MKSCSLGPVSIADVYRRINAVRHPDSQRTSSQRSAAQLTETSKCHATSEETSPTHMFHRGPQGTICQYVYGATQAAAVNCMLVLIYK